MTVTINGTSGVTTPGTTLSSGSITFADATTQSTAPVVGVYGQVFTSSGTFTIPTGVTALKVTVIGGGAGGAGGNSNYYGGGGSGGGTAIKYLTGLTPGATLAVTVGAAGTAGGGNGGTGGAGGNSTVASGTQSITTITGGGAASNPWANTNIYGSGAAGSGTNGDINLTGGNGAAITNYFPYSMQGSSAVFNSGGYTTAGFYGQGGRGGSNNPCTGGGAGSVGYKGIVIFEW